MVLGVLEEAHRLFPEDIYIVEGIIHICKENIKGIPCVGQYKGKASPLTRVLRGEWRTKINAKLEHYTGVLRALDPASPAARSFQTSGLPSFLPNLSTRAWVLIVIGVLLTLGALGNAVDEMNRKSRSLNVASTANISGAPSLPPQSTQTPAPVPTLTSVEKLARAKLLTAGQPSISEFDEAMNHLRAIPKNAREYKEAQALLKKTMDRAARVAAEVIVLGPKPENSAWDGSVRCVDSYLKETLNDYDSAEYLEWSPVTRIELKGEPYWAVRLKLRATNAFGGKILKEAVFFIRRNQVVSAVGLND